MTRCVQSTFLHLGSLRVRLGAKLLPPEDAALANPPNVGPGRAEGWRGAPVCPDAAAGTRSPARSTSQRCLVCSCTASRCFVLVRRKSKTPLKARFISVGSLCTSQSPPLYCHCIFIQSKKKKSPCCRRKYITFLKRAVSNPIKISYTMCSACGRSVCHSSFHDCLLSCSYCFKKHFMPYLHVFI